MTTEGANQNHTRELKAAKVVNERPGGETEASVIAWYRKNGKDVERVVCDACKKTIAIEALVAGYGNKHHPANKVVVPIKDRLLSYRKRSDGTLGYSCACGADNLLLSEEAELRGRAGVPPHVQDRINRRIKGRTTADKARMAKQSVFNKVKVK